MLAPHATHTAALIPRPSRATSALASVFTVAAATLLAGCAAVVPASTPPTASAPIAAQWHAPLPHDGQVTGIFAVVRPIDRRFYDTPANIVNE